MMSGKRRRLVRSLWTCVAGAVLTGTLAAQPVVQPLPRVSASQALNAALARLGRDPRDLDALIDAGKAALGMGDIDAAIGFFARADQLSPNNMRVKAGLAAALVRSENPYDAIPLFAEADKAGALDPALLADRGLAYDLVGDTATAQRYYRDAIAAQPSDDTLRRLALSQAIAGDRAGMELTLAPLLQRQDKAAWRTRAFALAILQKPEEAIAIADQTMPVDMAQSIAPYLRYMPRLTAAQQAAAANFGRFPRAAEIGRDDPRVALYAPPKRVAVAAELALAPAGKPLGRTRPARNARDERRSPGAGDAAAAPATPTPAPVPRAAPPDPMPTREVGSAPALAVAGGSPSPALTPASAPQPAAGAAMSSSPAGSAPAVAPASAAARPELAMAPATVATRVPAPVAPTTPPPGAAVASGAPTSVGPSARPALVPGGGFDLARLDATRPAGPAVTPAPVPTPAPAPAPAPSAAATGAVPAAVVGADRAVAPAAGSAPAPVPAPPVVQQAAQSPVPAAPAARPPARPAPARRALAEAFADLSVPQGPAAPAPGAVDVRKIAAAKPKPVEPPKPVHPSRIWVQVGTGRNLGALAFTWKGLVRENPELFRGKSSWTSDWGRTNRLLTGPFGSEGQAEAFLSKVKKAGLDAFLWTSPTGQVVDEL